MGVLKFKLKEKCDRLAQVLMGLSAAKVRLKRVKMNNYLLKCENINKFYQEGENQTQVLKGVSFSMEPAELVAIVGVQVQGKVLYYIL